MVILKFHKSLAKFRTVTSGCNILTNKASSLILNILTKLYNNTTINDGKFSIKYNFQLINLTKKLNNINNIKTFNFNDSFNNINANDMHKAINILFKINK